MITPRQRVVDNGKRQARRLGAAGRKRRALTVKRNREPLIPTGVLKALAAMNLPKNKRTYTAALRELLRGTS